MLESLGVDTAAERVYRAMLAHPHDGIAELAARLDLAENTVRHGLDELSRLALIRQSSRDEVGFRPVSPELAVQALLGQQQAELLAQQRRLEEAKAAAAQLIAEHAALRPDAGDNAERLTGEQEIRDRLALLADQARSSVSTFAPGGAHDPADLEASRRPNAALLERGVRMRTIYLDSVRNDAATTAHVEWLEGNGGEVRTVPTLPVRMILVDDEVAVLPIDAMDARAGAVVLRGSGTVAALSALFELTWSTAQTLGGDVPVDGDGLLPQERATLVLLAQGHTDDAVAKRLGVSPRTARRIASELMERLGARSRFQAGVLANAQGWLSSPD